MAMNIDWRRIAVVIGYSSLEGLVMGIVAACVMWLLDRMFS